MGRPPVSLGLVQRKVTDLLSKSTILGSPGAEGGPNKSSTWQKSHLANQKWASFGERSAVEWINLGNLTHSTGDFHQNLAKNKRRENSNALK